MTIEILTAGAAALFVFLLVLWLMRPDGGPSAPALSPAPKNPIGFA